MNASAQFEVLERMIMPGPVIAGHAEYESECVNCHLRFSRQGQRELCLDCHTEIAEDFATATGFHSLSADVGDENCAVCHTDHEGRDADILGLDRATFDHDLSDFPLRNSHVEVECDDCHVSTELFHVAETTCVNCHLEDDQHLGNLGDVCSDCHLETEWTEARYDHELESEYALLGSHADLSCVSCHVEELYMDTPNQCVDCHTEDDSHMGLNGPLCQDCHSPSDWTETSFDHFSIAGFALAGSHAQLTCESCHDGNVFEQTKTGECVSCHLDDDSHAGVNGEVCSDCHQTTEWLDVTFDHARDAEFALLGAHGELECGDCHIEPIAVALPETQCIGCHLDDDPHEAQLGEDCASCHAEVLWTENVRFDHGLTIFPLLGRHVDVVCEDCHATPAFHDAQETCVDCHVDDDVHEASLGPECAQCHTPLDWAVWRFDHDAQTQFPLTGAHDGLTCNACHREPVVDSVVALNQTCVFCHRSDDVHRGEFGDDCDTCHATSAFESLLVIQ